MEKSIFIPNVISLEVVFLFFLVSFVLLIKLSVLKVIVVHMQQEEMNRSRIPFSVFLDGNILDSARTRSQSESLL